LKSLSFQKMNQSKALIYKKKNMGSLIRNLLLIVLIALALEGYSQVGESALLLEGSYVAEGVNNFNGGLKRGGNYQGMIDLMATFDTKKAGLWEGGTTYVQLESTHGGNPSETNIGDYQVASNIDNGYYTYLYQAWYKQELGKFSVLAGIHDLNSEFLFSDYGGEYMSSSFGIMPSVSMNVPVPIFPKATLGTILRYQATKDINIQLGIYDGDPMDLDTDPYYQNFSLGKDDGILTVLEVWASTLKKEGYDGTLKVGAFHHSADFVSNSDTSKTYSGNFGVYLILDQIIIPFNASAEKGLGMFATIGVVPGNRNSNNYSWGLGFNYMAPFKGRTDDIIGLAAHSVNVNFLQDDLSINIGNETVIECFYKLNINDNIQVQPELQYIINPGAENMYDNATVGLIRAYFSF